MISELKTTHKQLKKELHTLEQIPDKEFSFEKERERVKIKRKLKEIEQEICGIETGHAERSKAADWTHSYEMCKECYKCLNVKKHSEP